MKVGIDASRAFIKNRTGIEEYSYQVIKHLIPLLRDDQVILYIKKNQKSNIKNQNVNIKIKIVKFPFLWTQLGLSLEMLFHPVDILFIPAHTVPVIHPENTVVTIHGLEYEFCPKAYSWWERFYMRQVIKNSCKWAKRIIAVSENTKEDLKKLYGVLEDKIKVIYEGYDQENQKSNIKNQNVNAKFKINSKYLFFIGRLEKRKNIIGIIKAFEILKEQYKLPHKLVLAGKFGYGEEKIREEIKNINCPKDIILLGYVSEEEKWELMKNADVFLFPTFYEGFGIPILEAQSVGVPVVAGDNSSIPEISTNYELNSNIWINTVLLIDSKNAKQIADATYKLISDKALRGDIIKKGYMNIERFSWKKCASEIAKIIKNECK